MPRPRAGTVPVKEGKLGKAAGRPELLGGPFFPVAEAEGFFSFGKVEIAKKPRHPDIDREGVPAAVSIEQHTPRNFGADARELLQMIGRPLRGP